MSRYTHQLKSTDGLYFNQLVTNVVLTLTTSDDYIFGIYGTSRRFVVPNFSNRLYIVIVNAIILLFPPFAECVRLIRFLAGGTLFAVQISVQPDITVTSKSAFPNLFLDIHFVDVVFHH